MFSSLSKWLHRKMHSIVYRGNQVQCNVCQSKFAKFMAYGAIKRPNAQCPNCKSLERHRMLWLFLNEKGLLNKKTKLLHVSPEQVFFERFSKMPNIGYFPVDKFEPGYKYPTGTQNIDITNLPYKDADFDAIICIHVLEHIPDDRKAMRELSRVLKPDGWAIILVPMDKHLMKTFEDASVTSPSERLRLFGQSDHLRLYGLDYKERLETSGFLVEVEDIYDKIEDTQKMALALLPSEDIYLCRKR